MNRISAIVLAAGMSRRFGPENKLLVDRDGGPLVRQVVEMVLATRPLETIVVTGHDAEIVALIVSELEIKLVHNGDFNLGMGSSIATGVKAVTSEAMGILVVQADMPNLTSASLSKMAESLIGSEAIVVARSIERNGIPVLFGSAYRTILEGLGGDKGGRRVWEERQEKVVFCDFMARELDDIDFPLKGNESVNHAN